MFNPASLSALQRILKLHFDISITTANQRTAYPPNLNPNNLIANLRSIAQKGKTDPRHKRAKTETLTI